MCYWDVNWKGFVGCCVLLLIGFFCWFYSVWKFGVGKFVGFGKCRGVLYGVLCWDVVVVNCGYGRFREWCFLDGEVIE